MTRAIKRIGNPPQAQSKSATHLQAALYLTGPNPFPSNASWFSAHLTTSVALKQELLQLTQCHDTLIL